MGEIFKLLKSDLASDWPYTLGANVLVVVYYAIVATLGKIGGPFLSAILGIFLLTKKNTEEARQHSKDVISSGISPRTIAKARILKLLIVSSGPGVTFFIIVSADWGLPDGGMLAIAAFMVYFVSSIVAGATVLTGRDASSGVMLTLATLFCSGIIVGACWLMLDALIGTDKLGLLVGAAVLAVAAPVIYGKCIRSAERSAILRWRYPTR